MEPESQVLDYAALMLMIIVFTIIPYGIIAIHDIPYNIAKKKEITLTSRPFMLPALLAYSHFTLSGLSYGYGLTFSRDRQKLT